MTLQILGEQFVQISLANKRYKDSPNIVPKIEAALGVESLQKEIIAYTTTT
jgi:hypothetical protein